MEIDYSAKHIFQYTGLTFLIAWALLGAMFVCNLFGVLKYGTIGGMLLVAAVGAAPAVSVYILYRKWHCVNGFGDFLKNIFMNDSIKKTVAVIAVFFPVHFFTGVLFGKSMGNPAYLFIVYIPVMIIGGGLEEIGWRGFLQPALEKHFPLPVATVLTGIIWSSWHIPLWFIANSSQSRENFVLFTLFCIWLCFMLNAIRKMTNCIFACILFHAWSNTVGSMFFGMAFGSIKTGIVYFIEIIITFLISHCHQKNEGKM